MNYGAEEFIDLIDEWMKDARFHQLVRYGQERHWLHATGLRETNHSDILAWLLAPDEGHGLGDFFLRRLLVEATTADDNVDEVSRLIARNRWPRLADIFSDGLHGFQVGREVPCGEIQIGGRSQKGYLDLLLLNRQRRLAILIERKAGRLAHDAQLERYEWWLNAHLGQYQVLKIVSDTGLVDQSKARARKWLIVDDDWLLESLQAAVTQNRTSERVCQRLDDYIATMLWREDADPYYMGIEADLDDFAAEQHQQIRRLRDMTLLGISIRKISSRFLMGEFLPKLSHRKIHAGNKAQIEQAAELAARYSHVIDAVLDRGAFNVLEDAIEKQNPGAFCFRQRRLRSGEQEIWIVPLEYEERKVAPLCLQVSQVEGDWDEQGNRPQSIRVRLKLRLRGFDETERASDTPSKVLAVFGRRLTTQENVTLRNKTLDKAEVSAKDLTAMLAELKKLADTATNAVASL